MAELSTIARPYTEALFATARGKGQLDAWVAPLDELAALMRHPQVQQIAGDPKLRAHALVELLAGLMRAPLPAEGRNFLIALIDNDRLAALPEVATQFRALKNQAEGVAECSIDSAFPLTDGQVAELIGQLSKKFGLKLKPTVNVDASLIGGVRVTVGDRVLDSSVRARLDAMQARLTA